MKTLQLSESTAKWLTVITIMMVAILEVLDSTIVNVSLPSMMGELGANIEQITWVLTSYIVASAIFMPLTGFIERNIGRKKLLLINITGFMITSALCGLATSLDAIIIFRVLQGAFGAALIPLSQAILRDTFPLEEQGKAMGIWGIGILTAPVLGPALGGFITENFSWRFIFYMNLPFCLIGIFLTLLIIKDTERRPLRIDWLGVILMAAGVGSLQIFLDQGNQHGWLSSHYILTLMLTSIFCLFIFIARGWKKENNVIKLKIFSDRNFSVATLILFGFCALLFAVIVVQPMMLQELFGYPVLTAGWTMAPRGLASMVTMASAAAIMKRYGVKVPVVIGILLCAFGTYFMANYNLSSGMWTIIWPTIIQGLGMGLLFVPLSTVALATLHQTDSSEGAGLFSYGRMLGSSVGISIASTFLARLAQINWHRLGGHIQPFNPNLYRWLNRQGLALHNPVTTSRLAETLHRQSMIIAYIDVYWAIAIGFMLLLPLVFLMKSVELGEGNLALH